MRAPDSLRNPMTGVNFRALRRRSQVVRQRSAKPRYGGSNPPGASRPPQRPGSPSCARPALRPPSWSWRAWVFSHRRQRPRSVSGSGILRPSAGTGRSTTAPRAGARASAMGAWPSGWRGARASRVRSIRSALHATPPRTGRLRVPVRRGRRGLQPAAATAAGRSGPAAPPPAHTTAGSPVGWGAASLPGNSEHFPRVIIVAT